MRVQVAFALLVVIACQVYAEESAGKVLSFFNVVKFPNSLCTGSGTRNGTCYTTEECEDRSGTAAGSCADGFGVCCVITMDCGGSTSENNTYFVKAAFTTATAASCSFTVCPASTDICRMRLDFKTFMIAGPNAAATATTVATTIGDCVDDSFAAPGAPVICGTNTGQHMFIDSDGISCANNVFSFDTSGSNSKSMDIMITQYDCKSNTAGPPGCLQYFTGSTDTISSFNFATTNRHLSSQNYDICIRRQSGMCSICYVSVDDNSFGLSNRASSTAADAGVGSECTTDFLGIPGGLATLATDLADAPSRFCGRFLNPASAGTASNTICSATRPFRLSFFSDGGEDISTAGAVATDELNTAPLGTVGFSVTYTQQSC